MTDSDEQDRPSGGRAVSLRRYTRAAADIGVWLGVVVLALVILFGH
jgi:hypothetical protein